jgi:hypothetical protein
MIETKCMCCGELIERPRQYGQRFCSRACGLEWHTAETKAARAFYRQHHPQPTAFACTPEPEEQTQQEHMQ